MEGARLWLRCQYDKSCTLHANQARNLSARAGAAWAAGWEDSIHEIVRYVRFLGARISSSGHDESFELNGRRLESNRSESRVILSRCWGQHSRHTRLRLTEVRVKDSNEYVNRFAVGKKQPSCYKGVTWDSRREDT